MATKLKKKLYTVKGKDGFVYYLNLLEAPRFYFSKKPQLKSLSEKPDGYNVLRTKHGLPFMKRAF